MTHMSMAYIFTHLTDNSFFCGHQFQPHSDIDPSCHNHSYRSLNCTGFSGEQLAKQVSPQLKQRDPCVSNTRNAPSKTGRWKTTHPTSIAPSLNADESDSEPPQVLNLYNVQIRESKSRAKLYALTHTDTNFSLHAQLSCWNRCCFG